MNSSTIIAIDLAKNVFGVEIGERHQKATMRKKLSRSELCLLLATSSPCVVAMESCANSQTWAKLAAGYGHTVNIVPTQHVKSLSIGPHKNDLRDAASIREAASRPDMKFVALKSDAQQELQGLICFREGYVKNKVSLGNHLHARFSEFGVTINKGERAIAEMENYLEKNPGKFGKLFKSQLCIAIQEYKQLKSNIVSISKTIDIFCKEHFRDSYRRLLEIPGVGRVTAAEFLCHCGDYTAYKNGRALSAALGLVPRDCSSGGVEKLGKITKCGNKRLRSLLVQCALSALKAQRKDPQDDDLLIWGDKLRDRVAPKKAMVAMANKITRIVWKILATGESYNPKYRSCCA